LSKKTNTSINRRDFLAGAAATAGFTVMTASAVRSYAANERIKVGFVGLGGRGKLISGMISKLPEYQLVALCDYFDSVVQPMGKEYNVPSDKCFDGLSGYKKVIDCDVDAIFLETPPCFFPEHVAASVNAGKHVYFAKPVACDVPGTMSILTSGKKATKNKQVFLIDFQVPTDPLNIEVVKHVQNGRIGSVSQINSIYCDQGFNAPPKTDTIASRLTNLIWVNDTNLGGGMLVNSGIHAVDAALWTADSKPVWAMGTSRQGMKRHGDTHDTYSITYMMENGIIVNHRGEHMNNIHEFTCRNMVWGDKGYAELGYMGRAWVRANSFAYRGGEIDTRLYRSGILYNLAKFAKCINEGNYENDTLQRGVETNLAVILGREACLRNDKLTREELIKENKKLDFDTTGLKV